MEPWGLDGLGHRRPEKSLTVSSDTDAASIVRPKPNVVINTDNLILRRLRQENSHEFEASLSYTVSFSLAWAKA